jgi:antitoxin ParD1/3/4
MPTQNVNLSEQQAAFIRKRIDEGHYRNASEVVRAALRLLAQREQEDELKLQTLRRMVTEGFDEIDRGEYELIDPADLDQYVERVAARARSAQPE